MPEPGASRCLWPRPWIACRDQENIAGLFKQLSFAGVRLITLSEGDIGELHVGLKGTMNALFLKDLAQKTRRTIGGQISYSV
jgi:site-specific DNA recombinase